MSTAVKMDKILKSDNLKNSAILEQQALQKAIENTEAKLEVLGLFLAKNNRLHETNNEEIANAHLDKERECRAKEAFCLEGEESLSKTVALSDNLGNIRSSLAQNKELLHLCKPIKDIISSYCHLKLEFETTHDPTSNDHSASGMDMDKFLSLPKNILLQRLGLTSDCLKWKKSNCEKKDQLIICNDMQSNIKSEYTKAEEKWLSQVNELKKREKNAERRVFVKNASLLFMQNLPKGKDFYLLNSWKAKAKEVHDDMSSNSFCIFLCIDSLLSSIEEYVCYQLDKLDEFPEEDQRKLKRQSHILFREAKRQETVRVKETKRKEREERCMERSFCENRQVVRRKLMPIHKDVKIEEKHVEKECSPPVSPPDLFGQWDARWAQNEEKNRDSETPSGGLCKPELI